MRSKVFFESTVNMDFCLEFIKAPAKINEELCLCLLQQARLFCCSCGLFDKLVGLDKQWQQDWNQKPD